ncbi:MAG: FkbM family methyltransferase [Ferruginibacter sp.]
MLKEIYKKITSKKQHKSPFEMLVEKALSMPRFNPATIVFENYTFHVPDMISVVWQLEEFFIDKKFNFKSAQANPVIYDCGANVGVASIFFSSCFPNAIINAYEADPIIIPYLEKNLLNNFVTNVNVFSGAVWINNEGVDFASEGGDGGSMYLGNEKSRVPSFRLKDKLSEENEVSFLKLDIEGSEVDVLKDCASELHKVRYLFVEYHSWKTRSQNLSVMLSVLENNGFRYVVESLGNNRDFFLEEFDNKLNMDLQLNIYAVNTGFKE